MRKAIRYFIVIFIPILIYIGAKIIKHSFVYKNPSYDKDFIKYDEAIIFALITFLIGWVLGKSFRGKEKYLNELNKQNEEDGYEIPQMIPYKKVKNKFDNTI